ncbi:type II toxin-antitoxin system RelE/ParE family toxin [Paenibacillus sp. 32352]|uniref:type II toxin-antitoxin system RelE/ParE family toxin n=1 Tax=Paenibacillus sp. 32352 TaxID=1969111 RepID=UPI0009AD023E|nr:type II toxin-antitoxin system RelE/ParE family toxin [Paenibacillus sp. 32352]
MKMVFYRTKGGASDVEKHLLGLNQKAAAGNQQAKKELADFYYCMERFQHGQPHSGVLQQGLYELRPGRHRYIYFFWNDEMVMLTEFRKTTNQTPDPELQRALKRMKDWKSRHPKK